ncbi:MAG: hypothetical protein P9L88_07745 [Candidatus Tantalella remota]|nr:hypothetical protein [Candidatus Tantalella remota]
MKKLLLIILLFSVCATISAAYEVKRTPEGEQVVLDEYRALTVFRDEAIGVDDIICAYLDSSHLEKEGFNIAEWYYLREMDENDVTIALEKLNLRLPSFAGANEDVSTFTVPVRGKTEKTGVFRVHGITVSITVSDNGNLSAKIAE